MRNFLAETKEILSEYGKTEQEVWWVGSKDGSLSIDWPHFVTQADFEYDSGYGLQEIASDLVVVGADWWMERREYNGSEWWEFMTAPLRLSNAKPFAVMRADTDANDFSASEGLAVMNDRNKKAGEDNGH
jgi:hypothetical protein